MKNEQRAVRLPSQLSLLIRILVAGYLLYTVFSMRDVGSRYSGGELMIFVAAMIVFGAAAAVIGGISARDLMRGRYIGGAMDENAEAGEEEKK